LSTILMATCKATSTCQLVTGKNSNQSLSTSNVPSSLRSSVQLWLLTAAPSGECHTVPTCIVPTVNCTYGISLPPRLLVVIYDISIILYSTFMHCFHCQPCLRRQTPTVLYQHAKFQPQISCISQDIT